MDLAYHIHENIHTTIESLRCNIRMLDYVADIFEIQTLDYVADIFEEHQRATVGQVATVKKWSAELNEACSMLRSIASDVNDAMEYYEHTKKLREDFEGEIKKF